jgi:hypothetical protein
MMHNRPVPIVPHAEGYTSRVNKHIDQLDRAVRECVRSDLLDRAQWQDDFLAKYAEAQPQRATYRRALEAVTAFECTYRHVSKLPGPDHAAYRTEFAAQAIDAVVMRFAMQDYDGCAKLAREIQDQINDNPVADDRYPSELARKAGSVHVAVLGLLKVVDKVRLERARPAVAHQRRLAEARFFERHPDYAKLRREIMHLRA